MITKSQIDIFFKSNVIAIAGVSRNPKKFGNVAFKAIDDKKKYTLYPINPNTVEINGQKCYRDIISLPEDVGSIILIMQKEQTTAAVKQAIDKGIKNIWIQQKCDTPEALKLAADSGANIIYGKCIMMFADPVSGFHRFHRSVMGFFGKLPK